MKIIGKEYRTRIPIEIMVENDVQGGRYKSLINIYIYIYDRYLVTQFASEYNKNSNKLFGKIPIQSRELKFKNLKKNIEKGNDPVSIGNYKVLKNHEIEMKWNFYEHGDMELVFKGRILLEGDAIKGTFYKNGLENVPERVYYNIDKALPDELIEKNTNA